MFKKLAWFTCWLLVLSLSLLFCFTLGLWQNWSTPTILLFWLFMLLLAVVLWGAFSAINRAIRGKQGRRWFEKYRLSRREYVLLNHWKAGARVIKRIRRQRAQLPWYLLIGERCGKSTLLASAGLPRFYGDNDDATTGPTRTIRWWFFRQLCVLDLSSNFLNGTATFRQTWRKLAQWCGRMPAPAGIIVALPVSALMSDDLSVLHAMARQQRALIEPLVRRSGERIPLYVMITQCDRFPGFSLWARQLSATQRQQTLGYSWHIPPHIDGQDELALRPLFSALKQGMSRVRLSMVYPKTLNAQEKATLLDFPESFASLEPKLRYAMASLCEPNAYFTHTFLNSVWFSAAELQEENRGRRASIFVHDLLTERLRDLSLRWSGQRWYQRPRGKMTCIVALAGCALWILLSASLSFNRLQPEIAQLSPDALTAFLAKDEQFAKISLRYLPFQPLLDRQQQYAESQLAKVPYTSRLAQVALVDFQQKILAADPAQQRELILQLADAVLAWQQMRDGATLTVLNQIAPVAMALQQRTYPGGLSPSTIMALERYYIQRPDGKRWLQTARRLLANVMNHDPTLGWLVAPVNTLPVLQANTFWPMLPTSVALPGIWTQAGQTALNDWMARIERAIQSPQPLFQKMREDQSTLRQDAWRQYLIDVTANLSSITPVAMPRSQLIALGQNQSQAMQFATLTLSELNDIPAADAQPWLVTLRQLQQLAANSHTSTLSNRAKRLDNRVRQSLTSWLRGVSPDLRTDSAPRADQAWRQWQNIRSGGVNEAVVQDKPGTQLTRGLFSVAQNNGVRNPLTDLLPALATLQERLSPHNTDISITAVWLLYQNDARSLLGNAMAQSACWLDQQWKSTVIWSLDKDSDQRSYEEQQVLTQQSVASFLQGPAKALLSKGNNGPDAAEYAGMKVPLTVEFIRFTRQTFAPDMMEDVPQRVSTRNSDQRASLKAKVDSLTLQQNELAKKSWKISVSSLPATVPGGAQVIPTGTQLTLSCTKGEQQLSSMNFAEKLDFSWQAGECTRLTLSVIFPDFTANYQLNGDDAWPQFINRFIGGETLIDSSDFGVSTGLLQQLGIKQILVRFTVSNPQEMQAAWQAWSTLNANINDLNDRIASLDERVDSASLPTISALPENVSQCQ